MSLDDLKIADLGQKAEKSLAWPTILSQVQSNFSWTQTSDNNRLIIKKASLKSLTLMDSNIQSTGTCLTAGPCHAAGGGGGGGERERERERATETEWRRKTERLT